MNVGITPAPEGPIWNARVIDELYKRGLKTVHVTSHTISEALILLTGGFAGHFSRDPVNQELPCLRDVPIGAYRVTRSYSTVGVIGYFVELEHNAGTVLEE